MHHLISMPRHFALGLVCAAVMSAGSAYAQNPSPEVARALSDSAQTTQLGKSAAQLRSADYIVAIVNSEPVTNNEVRARIQRVKENLQSQGIQQLPPEDELAQEVLERLIVEKIQVQTAKETGIKVDDYAVDQAIENIARQSGLTQQALAQEVARRGQSQASFREEIRNQMLLQRLQNREVDGRVQVSEHDIDQFMAQQRQKGGQDDVMRSQLNLGHILIAVPENASEAEVARLQARAQEALQAARTEADFAAVAQPFWACALPIATPACLSNP